MKNTLWRENESQAFNQLLMARRSTKAVASPGPTPEQIELALQAAAAAPDHGALRVWRFALLEQPDIVTFVERAIAALASSGLPMSPEKQTRARTWLANVPLLVGLAYKIHHDNPKVPEIEQTLSMGAAVMNFQNSMHAMGFASFWSTGLGTFSDEVPTILGFDPLDYRFVGFLAVGTATAAPMPRQSVASESLVTHWSADKV